jgi:prophage regulatory protein
MLNVERTRTIAERVLPKSEVLRITGFAAATLWREIRAKRFPAPIPISPKRVGFLESEVQEWLYAAKTARDAARTRASA